MGPTGVITGFAFGPASTADQQAAETFFALRAYPNAGLGSVGRASPGTYYVVDKGFEGADNRRRWFSSTTWNGSYARPSATPERCGRSI